MDNLQDRIVTLREKHRVVGASPAVLHDGDVHCAASGLLNLSTGVEATTDSVFQIGSITKVWTTTVLMQLVDEGKLHLDSPVRTYVPGLHLRDEDTAARITTRHLLTHTSGIDGDHFFDTGRGDDALERYADSLKHVAQIHPLEATFSYCNTGFSLAGRVIEVMGSSLDITAAGTGLRGLMSVSGPAAAVLGASLDVPVAALDPEHGRFLLLLPQAGWSQAVFSTLPDGHRCLHICGRAYSKRAA